MHEQTSTIISALMKGIKFRHKGRTIFRPVLYYVEPVCKTRYTSLELHTTFELFQLTVKNCNGHLMLMVTSSRHYHKNGRLESGTPTSSNHVLRASIELCDPNLMQLVDAAIGYRPPLPQLPVEHDE